MAAALALLADHQTVRAAPEGETVEVGDPREVFTGHEGVEQAVAGRGRHVQMTPISLAVTPAPNR
jgi:hypothetical protein